MRAANSSVDVPNAATRDVVLRGKYYEQHALEAVLLANFRHGLLSQTDRDAAT